MSIWRKSLTWKIKCNRHNNIVRVSPLIKNWLNETIFFNFRLKFKTSSGLLAVVSFLVLLSTTYDIIYTKSKCKFPSWFYVLKKCWWCYFLFVFADEKSEALLMFSFYSNGMKLFSCTKSNSLDAMDCIHGIRAISTISVIFGHIFVVYMMFPLRNVPTFAKVNNKLNYSHIH